MYAVTVNFQISPDAMERFLPLMIANARASIEREPGCKQFDVCRDGTSVFLYELYDNQASFEAHLATEHFKAFDTAVTDMVIEKDVRVYDEVHR